MTWDGDTPGIGIRKTMPATLSLALLSGGSTSPGPGP